MRFVKCIGTRMHVSRGRVRSSDLPAQGPDWRQREAAYLHSLASSRSQY